MLKFDNYVFYAFCDYSYILYRDTHYRRYRSFCCGFRSTIQLDNFSNVDWERLFAMCGYLMLLFGFNVEESMGYIKRYFLEDKFIIFELPTRNIREYFPTSFN